MEVRTKFPNSLDLIDFAGSNQIPEFLARGSVWVRLGVGIPTKRQNLVFNKKLLEDNEKTMEETGITDGAKILLLVTDDAEQNCK